jgi:hypothetical protein
LYAAKACVSNGCRSPRIKAAPSAANAARWAAKAAVRRARISNTSASDNAATLRAARLDIARPGTQVRPNVLSAWNCKQITPRI